MSPDPIIYSASLAAYFKIISSRPWPCALGQETSSCNGKDSDKGTMTLDHGPPPMDGVKMTDSSPSTGVILLFPQSQVRGFRIFSKKYSCYLLKQILSLPHLIIQWWTLELSTGWKITCFSKYKISISAAFASPSFSHPWPQQPPAIQTLAVIMWRSEKEKRTGRKIHFLSVGCLLFFVLSAVQGLCRFTWCFIMETVLVGTNEFICRDARSLKI